MSEEYKVFKPKYFAKSLDQFAKEVLPEAIYKQRGVKGLQLMSIEILEFIELFRYHFGKPIYINDWSWGGNFSESGLRDEKHYGSAESFSKSLSQHKFGNAVDIKCKSARGAELRQFFIKNKHLFPMISFVECGPVYKTVNGVKKEVPMSWAHFDARTRISDEQVVYWSPVKGVIPEESVLEFKL